MTTATHRPPDTVLIAMTMADDTVEVMAFVVTEYTGSGLPRWSRPATEEEVEKEIERTLGALGPGKGPVKSWRFIAREELPKDRTFRNAWRDKAKKLTIDMPHAREIHREHIREARAPILEALDVAYQRADEESAPATKRRLAVEKQALRDAPEDPAIEKAATPEDLKRAWPDTLKDAAVKLGYLTPEHIAPVKKSSKGRKREGR